MPRSKKSKRLTPAEQSARFIEAAKKAEADGSAENFEDVFKRLVKAKKARRPTKRGA